MTTTTIYITETKSAILDFTEALERLELADKDRLIIKPLIKEVINAVRGATGDVMMKGIHKMMRLQRVLKRVATRLLEPTILIDLIDQDSKTMY